MKYLLIGGAVVAIFAYAWAGKADPNVYSMPMAEVYQKLTEAKIDSDYKGVLGKRDISISGNGENVVYWSASGAHALTRCQADLVPEGSSSTRITAFCDGGAPSAGAAAGMVHGMMRKRMIEHIDATLTNRPFDSQKALGATASMWPSDVRQPDGSLGTAVNDAVKMDREMRQSMKDWEKEAQKRNVEDQMKMRSAMPSTATRPMTDLSN